jgi:histidinol-phosphate aminotransferase
MSKYWSPLVRSLSPYVPGEQPKDTAAIVKLNTNENPYPPSPKVMAAIKRFDEGSLRLYPDPDASELTQALARQFSLDCEQVFVGNGSDEILALAFMAFFKQSNPILFPDVTYSFYQVYCQLFDIAFEQVPLAADFQIDVNDYCKPCGGVIIANPNAPTGVALSLHEIETLLKSNADSVVLIDEAYVDFGAESAVALIQTYPNLLVVQTFSKSRALAGMRIGYALGNRTLIEGLNRVKNSFNSYPLDRLAQCAGVEALEDAAYFEKTRQEIIALRDNMILQLEAIGFDVLPSSANFVFARHAEKDAEGLYLALKNRGVLVRHFNQGRISNYLRISVGTQREIVTLMSTLNTIL